MKKLFSIAIVAACLSLGVDKASALEGGSCAFERGPFMITFGPWCDCVTLYFDKLGGNGLTYGTWDRLCDSSNFPVIGDRLPGRLSFGAGTPSYDDAVYKFVLDDGGLFDLVATVTGEAGDLHLIQDDQPYFIANGSCPGAPVNAGKPPMTANRAK